MNLNRAFQEFQTRYDQVTDYYQRKISLAQGDPQLLTETFEKFSVAVEELSVAQEELLQQNQELEVTRLQVEAERRRYQDLFELAPDGYLVTDEAGVIREANRAAAELLNVPKALLVGKPLIVFIPSQARRAFRTKLNRLLEESDKFPEWELHLMPRQGKVLETAVTVSKLPPENGYSSSWLWLIRDITQRRRTEVAMRKIQILEATNLLLEQDLQERQRLDIALRQSEERFRYIFEAVGVSIWEEDFSVVKAGLDRLKAQGITDLRQYCAEHPAFVTEAIAAIKILDVNETAIKIFEAQNKEQLLESLENIFLPETIEAFVEELLAIANEEDVLSGETVLRTLRGRTLHVLFTITFPDPGGLYDQVLITLLDISDRKRAELLLHQQAAELQQLNTSLTEMAHLLTERNQELDRFVYVVSHDLKAPLRAISNLSTWLAEDLSGQLSQDSLSYTELLKQRVHRMEDMIDGLLAYSRVGRAEAATQKVDVGELLAEILDSLAPPPSFTIVLPKTCPTIEAKRLLLSQVFSNLISNALKHHDRSDGRIDILVVDRGDYCEFAVADDGPGIAPENYERVFDIFQTLKIDSTKENTGIGLSIVKKILEGEGGTIWLDSQLGQGTAFYFTWPKETH